MGAPVVFTPLKIAASRDETHELVHMELDGAPASFFAAYHTPGQYVQVKAGELKPGFFALASGPREKRVELLIKRGSPVSDAVAALPIGAELPISAPLGNGYPLSQARGHDVFAVGVGSGIAPLRALIHEIIRERPAFKRVFFVYGARSQRSLPYSAEIASWRAANIDVALVCSQPAHGEWSGHVGRVQNVLLNRNDRIDPDSSVFICGMKAMVEDVKAAFAQLGLKEGRVYQNF